jgi:DNA-binding XRE family transcriptional regulator
MSPRIRLRGATQFRGKLAGLLAREIRRARAATGLSQYQAAKECELKLERYVDIEEGLAVTANLSTMDRIAAVLGLDWDDVFVKREEDKC